MKFTSLLIGLLLLVPGLAGSLGETRPAAVNAPTPPPPASTTATTMAQASGLQFDFAVTLDARPLASATLHGDPLYEGYYEGSLHLNVAGRESWLIGVKLYTTEVEQKQILQIDIYDADRISRDYGNNNVLPLFSTTLNYQGGGVYPLSVADGTSVSVTVRDDASPRPSIIRTGRVPLPQGMTRSAR